MKRKQNSEKGFTIMECILAIAVILIIMGCALSIYQSTMKKTNRRWNNYLSTLMADNFLAAFQASDDSENFISKMNELTVLYSNDKEADLPIKNEYDEIDLSTIIQNMQVGTVRTDSNGKTVSFYHSNVAGNAFPSEAALTTLSYASAETMANNMQLISSKNESTGKYISVKYVSPNNSKVTFNYTVTVNTVYISATDANGTKHEVSYPITTFERYLFEKGWFLKITSETDDSSYKNGYKLHKAAFSDWDSIIFEIYDSATGQKAKDESGKYWYAIYIGDDQDKTWYSEGSYFKTEMSIRIAKTSSTTLAKRPTFLMRNEILSDNDFGEVAPGDSGSEVTIPYFLSYIVNGNKQNFEIASKIDSVANYTDYKVNAEISYALYDEDGKTIKFIYDNGNENIVYKYSEKDETKYAETLANVKKVLSGDPVEYENSSTEKKIYIPFNVTLNKVVFDDAKFIISFCRDDVEIVRFDYSASDDSRSKYNTDKNSIVSSTGLYNKYYASSGTDIVLIEAYTRNASVFLREEKNDDESAYTKDTSYLLILKDSNNIENTIFTSNSSSSITQQAPTKKIDEWTVNINLTDIVEERFYQYTPNNGEVTLIAKVTYSHVSFDSSFEPRITIWIVPTSKVKNELADDITLIEYTNMGYDEYIYLTYRKG